MCKDGHRPAVAECVDELTGREVGAERDGHGTDKDGAEKGGHEGRGVGREERDPLVATDAESAEGVPDTLDVIGQLPIRDGPAVGAKGDAARVARGETRLDERGRDVMGAGRG